VAHDDVVDEAVVRVEPDLSGFRRKLDKDLKKAMTPPPVVKVKVVADVGGIQGSIAKQAKQASAASNQYFKDLQRRFDLQRSGEKATLKAVQDRAAAEQKAAVDRQRKDEAYTRFVQGNEAQIRKIRQQGLADQLREAHGTHDRIEAIEREGVRQRAVLLGEVEKIEKAALREAEKAEKESLNRRTTRVADAKKTLSDLKPPKIIDLGASGFKPMNLLIAGVVALTPALLEMGSSAVQASAGLTALGAAGIGAGLAMTSLLVSFTPVVQAFKLAQTLDIQKHVKAQKNAVTGAKQAAINNEDAAKSARDYAAAQRDLASAQRDEKDASAGIHKARREAIRDLEDLRQSVIDLNNQYRGDKLSVEEAKLQEKNTNANFFATALDRLRAHQDTLDAQTRLADTALERRQKKQDLAQSLKGGIEKSDKVLQARRQAQDARNRRLDAQDRLAAQKTSKAKKAITDAAATSGEVINTTAEQLRQLRAQMSPAQRELLDFLTKNLDLFRSFGRTMSQKTVPGFTKMLRFLIEKPKGGKSSLAILAEDAGDLGAILGKYAARFGEFTQSPLFRDSMAEIQKHNASALDKLGQAAETFLKPVLRLLKEASPLLEPLSAKILELARRFDHFIEDASKNGTLKQFFADAATEAKNWYDIFANVLTFLKDIFLSSKGGGSALTKSFKEWTDSIVKWSDSKEGLAQMRGFFDKIASLPFAQIRDMLIQFTEMFTATQLVKWIYVNPFMSALGLMIGSNPGTAAGAVGAVASLFETIAKYAVEYPKTTALVLALTSLLKLKGAGGFVFRLIGLDKLRDFLAGKFKVFDKLLGGAATSVMNVRASVVNVYGGAGGPGGPAPGGKGGKSTARQIGGNLALSAGLALGAYLADQISTEGDSPFKKGMTTALQDGLSGAAIGASLGGPIGAVVGGIIGASVGSYLERQRELATATGKEAYTFGNLQGDVRRFGFMEGEPTTAISKLANRQVIQDYIAARRESVRVDVEAVRASKGEAAARQEQAKQTQASVNVLTDQLVAYGADRKAAYDYAAQVYDLNTAVANSVTQTDNQSGALGTAKTKYDDLGNAVDSVAGKAETATTKVGTLSSTIDGVSKTHVIGLKTDNFDDVYRQLQLLWSYQHVLYNPNYSNSAAGADTISSQVYYDAKKAADDAAAERRREISRTKRADGGYIRGPGTDTSDSIPAWLSNNEYVMPAKTVRHYGVEAMDAMRDRQVPRFAKGGPVAGKKMPFLVGTSGTQAPSTSEIEAKASESVGVPGTGGLYKGKIPKGLGDVAGLTNQMMAAVKDLKAHFPFMSVSSGVRTGRAGITVTGNKSYHNYGRAADLVPPNMPAFDYLAAKYGKIAREIIYSPANNRQIWNGKPHLFSGAVRKGHFSHIHLALANGGLVRSFDKGGTLPPGYTLAFNGTGKNETVRSNKQERQLSGPIRLDRRDLQWMAAAMNAGTTTVSMDGRKVAELTNRYNYLPAGV
jgi:hypothetical protein